MKKLLIAAAIAAIAAVPAAAVTVVGATSVRITSVLPDFMQISEFKAFNFSALNVAASANGGSAISSSDYALTDAGKAIDGNTQGDYPNMWHSAGSGSGEFIDISFAAPSTLSSLSIQGRNAGDCCSFRDLYLVTVYGGEAVLYSGRIDARDQIGSVSFDAPTGVPEPQTWALLVAGFGLVGVSLRRRKSASVAA